MNPLVTYIIPCYNKEKYLKECLDSVMVQDYEPIEIVLVNDASTDKSMDIFSAYIGENCRAISLEENRGVGYALRQGYRESRGEYLCFLSADDVLRDKDKTVLQVAAMDEDKSIDLTFFNQFMIGESLSSPQEHVEIPMWYNRILMHKYLTFMVLLEMEFIGSASLMHRRESYFRLGEWHGGIRNANDHLLMLNQVMAGAKIRMLEGNPVLYRKNPDQLSHDPDFNWHVAMVNGYWRSRVRNGDYPFWLKMWVRFA